MTPFSRASISEVDLVAALQRILQPIACNRLLNARALTNSLATVFSSIAPFSSLQIHFATNFQCVTRLQCLFPSLNWQRGCIYKFGSRFGILGQNSLSLRVSCAGQQPLLQP